MIDRASLKNRPNPFGFRRVRRLWFHTFSPSQVCVQWVTEAVTSAIQWARYYTWLLCLNARPLSWSGFSMVPPFFFLSFEYILPIFSAVKFSSHSLFYLWILWKFKLPDTFLGNNSGIVRLLAFIMANVGIDLNPVKLEGVWHFAPIPVAVSSDLIIRKWQLSTCFSSFWQICFSEAMWRLQKSLKICSGAEAERVCGCLSWLPKATAWTLCQSLSLRFGLSESSVATVCMEILTFFPKRFTMCIKYINTTKQTQKSSSLLTKKHTNLWLSEHEHEQEQKKCWKSASLLISWGLLIHFL